MIQIIMIRFLSEKEILINYKITKSVQKCVFSFKLNRIIYLLYILIHEIFYIHELFIRKLHLENNRCFIFQDNSKIKYFKYFINIKSFETIRVSLVTNLAANLF